MRLDDRLTVQNPSTTTDEYGEEVTTFSDGQSFFAHVRVSTPNEARQGSVPEESSSVTIQARTEDVNGLGIGRDTRLKFDGDVLRVHGVRDFRRDGVAEFQATRVR